MKKGIIIVVLMVLAGASSGRLAGDATFWRQFALAASATAPDRAAAATQPRLVLAGAPAAQARASAESELLAPEALQQAQELARGSAARALLVHRHGHRVFEYFAAGTSADTAITAGELTPAIMALALGPLVDTRRIAPDEALQHIRDYMADDGSNAWRNPWSAAARRRFSLQPPPQWLLQHADGSLLETLSLRVWQPLHAESAAVWGRDEQALRLDCCIVARLGDWMRLGDVLLQQGAFAGERLTSADWVRALLPPDAEGRRHPAWLRTQSPWTGAEPPASRDTSWFDLGPGVRLWLVPRRGLAVLYWAQTQDAARDTAMPNLLIRGLLDQAPPIDAPSALDQIVPGH
jgi:hypothetical protein